MVISTADTFTWNAGSDTFSSALRVILCTRTARIAAHTLGMAANTERASSLARTRFAWYCTCLGWSGSSLLHMHAHDNCFM